MSDESRLILEQLGQINQNITEMKADITELKANVAELKTDVAELKTDVAQLKADMSVVKRDIRVLKFDVNILKDKMADLEDGQRTMQLFMENEISKKINIIGDGHFFVMKSLNELRSFQEEKEIMDLKILDLQIEVKKIKKHLKIA